MNENELVIYIFVGFAVLVLIVFIVFVVKIVSLGDTSILRLRHMKPNKTNFKSMYKK